ncbi:GatB/YqeY domain-containing protein [Balamuthia mandrillaris]
MRRLSGCAPVGAKLGVRGKHPAFASEGSAGLRGLPLVFSRNRGVAPSSTTFSPPATPLASSTIRSPSFGEGFSRRFYAAESSSPPISFQDRLMNDLKAAMKAKDQLRTNVIRQMRTKITSKEKAAAADKNLDDGESIAVVRDLLQEIQQAIQENERMGAAGLAAQLRSEAAILEEYLPRQATAEQVEKAVREAVAETGATSPRDTKRVMEAALQKLGDSASKKQIGALGLRPDLGCPWDGEDSMRRTRHTTTNARS